MAGELFTLVSVANPARITLFRNAWVTDPAEFSNKVFSQFQDLARFFVGRPALRRATKRDVPLFSRGLCKGERLKENLRPPYLVIMDVDKVDVPMIETYSRLNTLGVEHVVYPTWSDTFREEDHSYRVITNYLADSWRTVEVVTRALFDQVGMEPTRESWDCFAFFVPAEPSDS